MVDSNSIQQQMRDLATKITLNDHLYYVLDAPVIPDDVYDVMMRNLRVLESEHPTLVLAESPTQRVGGTAVAGFTRVVHHTPMLSLGNVFSSEDLIAWILTVVPVTGDRVQLTAEWKYDGLALSLYYANGHLTRALTRGDGDVGEDVTHIARTIRTIPLVLPEWDGEVEIEIRGEVVMPLAGFNKMNAALKASGQKTYVNPRNAAAGCLRQLNPEGGTRKPLAFYAYGIVHPERHGLATYTQAVGMMRALGFQTGMVEVSDYHGLVRLYNDLMAARETLPIDIDGMVIKVNDFKHWATLPGTAREPGYAVAYKFPAQSGYTTLESVDWQVGRTGVLTPVARISPVFVSGVTVSNVTLHNFDEIQRLDVYVGDQVIVSRQGDVIPKIVQRLGDHCDTGLPVIKPGECPSCGTRTYHPEGQVALVCMNRVSCPAQLIGKLSHYVSRGGMDIDGLGESQLVDLIREGLITGNFADLYHLGRHNDHMCSLAGWGETSVRNLLAAIEQSKTPELKKFLFALGIPNVGEGTAKRLAAVFDNWRDVERAGRERLIAIPDIGPDTADGIVAWFSDPDNFRMMEALDYAGIRPITPHRLVRSGGLTGQVWVVTGSFPIHRDQIVRVLESNGAKVASGVSVKTTHLLAGESAGSKLAKAKELGTAIVTWDNYLTITAGL